MCRTYGTTGKTQSKRPPGAEGRFPQEQGSALLLRKRHKQCYFQVADNDHLIPEKLTFLSNRMICAVQGNPILQIFNTAFPEKKKARKHQAFGLWLL